MLCKITWKDLSILNSEDQQKSTEFALKDYYLTADQSSNSLNCTLWFYFNHEQEVLFENRVLDHNCVIENIELIINNETRLTYDRFSVVSNYTHSLNSTDQSPVILIQFR